MLVLKQKDDRVTISTWALRSPVRHFVSQMFLCVWVCECTRWVGVGWVTSSTDLDFMILLPSEGKDVRT